MARYRILESVGHQVESVHTYEDLEIHHPSNNRLGLKTGRASDFEAKKVHQKVDGHFEEVRLQSDGHTLVKKDFILTQDVRGPVKIPAPVEGYVHYLHDPTEAVRIYDRPHNQPGAKLLGQVLHMDPRSFDLPENSKVAYGQPLGVMSDTGIRGSVHAHVELEPAQFRRYIRDIDQGVITPSSFPGHGHRGSAPAVLAHGQLQKHEHQEGRSHKHSSAIASTRRSPVLETGVSGPQVESLQNALNRLGVRDERGNLLDCDGKFGSHTREAVEKFQRDHGLEIDGRVGKHTLEALTDADRSLVSHPDHAHHPLFKQSLAGVHRSECERGIASGVHSEHVAGAVTVQAVRDGLQRVDRVELNESGSLVRGVQVGTRDEPGLNRATQPMETSQAVQQSVAESSRQLQDAEQRRQTQVEQQHMHLSRPTVAGMQGLAPAM